MVQFQINVFENVEAGGVELSVNLFEGGERVSDMERNFAAHIGEKLLGVLKKISDDIKKLPEDRQESEVKKSAPSKGKGK